MNVHLLTRTGPIKLTREIWFCQCRCLFNHTKTTELFVIVDSGFSHGRLVLCKTKKKHAPWSNWEQNLLFYYRLWLVTSNYLLQLLRENKIPLCPLVWFWPTASLCSNRHFLSLFSFDYANHSRRAEAEVPAHKFESMTKISALINPYTLPPTHTPPQTHWHLSCSELLGIQ